MNLPDDPAAPDHGNRGNLARAQSHLEEALAIFAAHGERAKAEILAEPLADLQRELIAA
jgi:hypothetical protein